MAKESLREHLNRKLKEKGTTLKAEKAKAKKYKSIAEAKKAKSLYYTDKNGKVMAAVYATDLKDKGGLKTSLRPVLRPKPDPKDKPKTTPKTTPKVIPNDGPITEKTKAEVEAAMGGNYRKDALRLSGKFNKSGTGFKAGGMAMVTDPKTGKKIPEFAADGKGKMNKGGMTKSKSSGYMHGGTAKKKPAAKKMMAGGMAKKKPAAKKMMGGGSTGYMYGGMTKKKK